MRESRPFLKEYKLSRFSFLLTEVIPTTISFVPLPETSEKATISTAFDVVAISSTDAQPLCVLSTMLMWMGATPFSALLLV